MSLCQVTLSPVNVQLGGTDTGLNDTLTMPGPVPVGGGSISDDSDSSYLEMGSRYSSDEYGERADLLLADFTIDPVLYPNPTWMYMSVRVKNEDGYLAALDTYSLFPRWAWYRADGGGALFRQNMPAAITAGSATSPTWFDQVYTNSPIIAGDPGDDTNWLNLPRDWSDMLDPLTTTGLRFGMYCTSSAPTRVPLIDVFEIRMVVAYGCGTGRTFMPPLRLYPREDGRGMSSAARVYPPPRTSRYGRIGPGSVV